MSPRSRLIRELYIAASSSIQESLRYVTPLGLVASTNTFFLAAVQVQKILICRQPSQHCLLSLYETFTTSLATCLPRVFPSFLCFSSLFLPPSPQARATGAEELFTRQAALSSLNSTLTYSIQLLTDRFSLSNNQATPCNTTQVQYCGGTWVGITNHLDYIQGMGFDSIWISPIVANVEQTTAYGQAYHGFVVDRSLVWYISDVKIATGLRILRV